MMNKYKYSASTNLRYLVSLLPEYSNPQELPADMIDITDDIAEEYFDKTPPPGKMRSAGLNGLPVWTEIPAPSREELINHAEHEKQRRIDEAMQSVSVIKLKLQAGRKLTDIETIKLNQTLDYIDAVEDTDTSTAPEINWPTIQV